MVAQQSQHVNVTPVSAEKMEAHACSVQETLHQHILSTHTRPVNVTLVIREKMEPHARSATPALLNPGWGLLVFYVLLIQSHLLAASQTLHVNVMLGTQE